MKLTLLLGTQRSGSSLTAQRIHGIGGLGLPGEHLIPLFGKNSERSFDAADVRRLVARGVDPRVPGVTGLKAMVNQTARAMQCIAGQQMPIAEATAAFVDWADTSFDAVNLVLVRRQDVLGQAISRVVAQQTQVFHVGSTLSQMVHDARVRELEVDALVRRLPKACAAVAAEEAVLTQIADQHGTRALVIRYQELCAEPERIDTALRDHARAAGLTPGDGRPKPRLQKVLPEALVAELRTAYAARFGPVEPER